MKKDVLIVGGGIIGLMCAYFLQAKDRQVCIIDEGDFTSSSSFGNAGLLSAFDEAPLSHPGVIGDTLKLILKGESPVKFHLSSDLKLYSWLLNFIKNANASRVEQSKALFEKYGEISCMHYEYMQNKLGFDLDYHRDGMLVVCTEEKSLSKLLSRYQKPNNDRFEILSKKKTKEYLPILNDEANLGSVLFKKNGRIDSKKLMNSLRDYLKKQGVEFRFNEEIKNLEFNNSKVSKLSSDKNSYEPEDVILATGYKDILAKISGRNLMMTPAKGYNITFNMPKELRPKVATMFADLFIVMTPRQNDVRLTSKLELGTKNPDIIQAQIQSIKNNLKKYTKEFKMENELLWTGFRPLTPNDVPLFGKDEKYNNLYYGMGLGWLGITFGPAIGEILCDMLSNNKTNKTSEDVELFSGLAKK